MTKDSILEEKKIVNKIDLHAELIETGSNKNFEEDIFFGQEGFSVGGDLDPLTNGFVTSVNVSDRA